MKKKDKKIFYVSVVTMLLLCSCIIIGFVWLPKDGYAGLISDMFIIIVATILIVISVSKSLLKKLRDNKHLKSITIFCCTVIIVIGLSLSSFFVRDMIEGPVEIESSARYYSITTRKIPYIYNLNIGDYKLSFGKSSLEEIQKPLSTASKGSATIKISYFKHSKVLNYVKL